MSQMAEDESRLLRVWVKPGSRKGPLVEPAPDGVDAEYVVYVQERAVDGSANRAVERVLAKHLETSVSTVRIVRGHAARFKVIQVER